MALWLIGIPNVRTMPVLMVTLINNQLVIQVWCGPVGFPLGAIVPAVAFARRILSARTIAAGFGALEAERYV